MNVVLAIAHSSLQPDNRAHIETSCIEIVYLRSVLEYEIFSPAIAMYELKLFNLLHSLAVSTKNSIRRTLLRCLSDYGGNQ